MKKVILFASLCLLVILAACSSPEAEELVKYHNSYIKTVNEKAKQVDQNIKQSMQAQTPAEAYEIQKNKVQPLVKEIQQYIESQKPESKIVKELHAMRLNQIDAWSKAFNLRLEALEKLKSSSASQQEVTDIMKESQEKLNKAIEIGKQADQKFTDLAKEYNIELTDNK